MPSNFKHLQNSLQSKLFAFSLNSKAFCPVFRIVKCRENKKGKPGSKAENKSRKKNLIGTLYYTRSQNLWITFCLVLNQMSIYLIAPKIKDQQNPGRNFYV